MSRAPVAFLGVGYSAIDRVSERGILSYAHEAALDALRASGIDPAQVDGYVGVGTSPNGTHVPIDGFDRVSAYLMVESLGLGQLGWVSDVSGFSVDMAAAAAAAIGAGECTVVLGVRAVYNAPGVGGSTAGEPLAVGAEQWTLPVGAGPGGTRFGQRARRYLETYGARREDLWEVVSAARAHAAGNPWAVFHDREVTLDDYLDAPIVVDPLCLYDCDMPVCGAAAFVLVTGDLARESGRPVAWLRATANWTNADSILTKAGISTRDIDVCQLYDGYSSMVYEWIERLGWCDEGAAWKFVSAGETRPGGTLPVNTFGGALGEGRLHGMGHLREGISQILGTAGARQVADVEHCLVQVGPFDRSALAILSREAA